MGASASVGIVSTLSPVLGELTIRLAGETGYGVSTGLGPALGADIGFAGV